METALEELQEDKQMTFDSVCYLHKRQSEAKAELVELDNQVRQKASELRDTETKLAQVKQQAEPTYERDQLKKIEALHPDIHEQIRIFDLCQQIGIRSIDIIRKLFRQEMSLTAKEGTTFFSPEHNHRFLLPLKFTMKVGAEPDNPNKLRLLFNGTDILQWFRQQWEALQQRLKPKEDEWREPVVRRSRGMRM